MASAARALCQALAVRDDAALDSCFAVQDEAVIAGSLAQLNAGQAGALLDALVERLQAQPQQAARLVAWLRTLLANQGPTLAAAPAAQASLHLALDLMQERTASFNSLLSLAGRLQVVQPASTDGTQISQGAAAQVLFSA